MKACTLAGRTIPACAGALLVAMVPSAALRGASVDPNLPAIPFGIVKVTATSSDTVEVTFDGAVDPVSAGSPKSYALSGDVPVVGATLGGGAGSVVVLETGAALVPGGAYRLSVRGVRAAAGFEVAEAVAPFVARLRTYATAVLLDRPLAYYRFEEAAGPSARNEGTLGPYADGVFMRGDEVGGAKPGAGPGPGTGFSGFSRANRAAVFDGVGDWVDTTRRLIDAAGPYTLEYWLSPERGADADAPGSGRRGVLGQFDAFEWEVEYPAAVAVAAWTPDGGTRLAEYPPAGGEWHHLAVVVEDGQSTGYLDGQPLDWTPDEPAKGAGAGAGSFFRGRLDEVAIFDHALPAERIAAHFRAAREGGVIPPEPARFDPVAVGADGAVVLSWAGDGWLQSAPTPSGPWTFVLEAASPFPVPADRAGEFFRLVGQ